MSKTVANSVGAAVRSTMPAPVHALNFEIAAVKWHCFVLVAQCCVGIIFGAGLFFLGYKFGHRIGCSDRSASGDLIPPPPRAARPPDSQPVIFMPDVYISTTGECFHSRVDCSGLRHRSQPLMTKRPCKKCIATRGFIDGKTAVVDG